MEQFVQAHLLHLLGEQCTSNSDQTLIGAVSVQEKCTRNSIKNSFKHLISLVCVAIWFPFSCPFEIKF